jgi:dTMP kinase
MQKGRLICLEGIEGTGKTTQLNFISAYLKERGLSVVETREPGGTPLAEGIRQLTLNPPSDSEIVTAKTELLLMFAARMQHIYHVIEPALRQGNWVICDRFTEASYAYQGGGRGIKQTFIDYLKNEIQGTVQIDRVILFDTPITHALKQVDKRGYAHDRIESENQSFFSRVRDAYLMRAKQYPKLYRIIEANHPITHVQSQIVPILNELIAC